MILDLYLPGDSFLHRRRPATKLLVLVTAGIVVFSIHDLWVLGGILAVVFGLLLSIRPPVRETVHQLKPVAILLVIIFIAHVLLTHWTVGLTAIFRFASLILLAVSITFTTRVSEMIDVLERALAPTRAIGLNPAKISFVVSLAIRFLPLIARQAEEIRQAQAARGLQRSIIATAVPLIIKTLRMADTLAEAIDSRGFDVETYGKDEDGDSHPKKVAGKMR